MTIMMIIIKINNSNETNSLHVAEVVEKLAVRLLVKKFSGV